MAYRTNDWPCRYLVRDYLGSAAFCSNHPALPKLISHHRLDFEARFLRNPPPSSETPSDRLPALYRRLATMRAAALAPPATALLGSTTCCRRRSPDHPLPQCRALPRPALQRPPASIPPSRARRPVLAAAGAAAVPEPGGSSVAAAASAAGVQHKRGWAAQLTPLSDPAANSKLLALSAVTAREGRCGGRLRLSIWRRVCRRRRRFRQLGTRIC